MKRIFCTAISIVLGLLLSKTVVFAEDVNLEPAVVQEGDTVTVNYTLTVDDEIIHSVDDNDPLVISIGNSQLIPAFEEKLMGMASGEKKSFEIEAQDGYGEEDPELFKEIPKEQIPSDVAIEAGKTIYVRGPDGQAYPVKIHEVKNDTVVMNFNHPLAGKKLKFDIELVKIDK